MRQLLAMIALVAAGAAHAGCTSSDSWTGQDKARHFMVGAAIGSGGMLLFDKPDQVFLFGLAVAAAKEAHDSRSGGTCSMQDFLATVGGAAAGAYGTAWIVGPNYVGFAARF